MNESARRGYLSENYRLFHIADTRSSVHRFHFHDFDKIVIPLSGNVTYIMEGKTYLLRKDDILLVPHHAVHQSVIRDEAPYERIVLWVNSSFLASQKEADLGSLFALAKDSRLCLLRLGPEQQGLFTRLLRQLEEALTSKDFAAGLMADTLFLQLMIYLNRWTLSQSPEDAALCRQDIRYDARIESILRYIEAHLSQELSAESLADRFFISKSHLMHRFREQTGCTLHRYIRQKRLLYARDLLMHRVPVTEACMACGFQDYSAFLRAFKSMFRCLPSEIYEVSAGSEPLE